MSRRDFHFVFGLRPQTEPFHLLHYLCLASCREVNRPDTLHFHYRHEPFGPYWERIRPHLNLRPVGTSAAWAALCTRYAHSTEGRLIECLGLQYAHESDLLRLELLARDGGAYADMDTLFVRPYPDAWFDAPFAIAEENVPPLPGLVQRASLCNAVLFAQPGSPFAVRWHENIAQVFDGSWSRHSCEEAARLWQRMPEALQVLPSAYCYRYGSSVTGLRSLLEEMDRDQEDTYSVHLWAHLWWDSQRDDFSGVSARDIDAAWIRERSCTLARLARPFLPD